MSDNTKPAKRVHKILVEWDEISGDVTFHFSSKNTLTNLGMLELAKEQVYQVYRQANIPRIAVPRPPKLT